MRKREPDCMNQKQQQTRNQPNNQSNGKPKQKARRGAKGNLAISIKGETVKQPRLKIREKIALSTSLQASSSAKHPRCPCPLWRRINPKQCRTVQARAYAKSKAAMQTLPTGRTIFSNIGLAIESIAKPRLPNKSSA